jgi:hypothetical protein
MPPRPHPAPYPNDEVWTSSDPGISLYMRGMSSGPFEIGERNGLPGMSIPSMTHPYQGEYNINLAIPDWHRPGAVAVLQAWEIFQVEHLATCQSCPDLRLCALPYYIFYGPARSNLGTSFTFTLIKLIMFIQKSGSRVHSYPLFQSPCTRNPYQ